ncbi:bladder cancer-associated protein isoform X1 [Trachypithecus francoisi]|uniref:bladder cancer-associated protein isoform X1 n=1 Tax=Trachypithecus francoisi TaxID=54180 RepID=UPI00141B8DFB|nr:bladder cancer-associated protein isoform X1 [Trachypithecus francoisi]
MGPRPAPLEDEGGVSPASCGVRGELRWRQAAADGDSGGGAMAGLAELEASRTGGCQLDLAVHIGKHLATGSKLLWCRISIFCLGIKCRKSALQLLLTKKILQLSRSYNARKKNWMLSLV